ncbi:nitrous oxide-stimulated promoter family protein [Bacteroides sp. OttesenSCG-928-J23]|nr:nitrous oxide-stimulated promoter family protein [Bacteroides sp. OttesenSCG-928-J23]
MFSSRIEEEKHTVELMIRLYCRKHKHGNVPCEKCMELLSYARARLNRCPFGEEKTTCKKCPRHCYRSDMRERMKQVMRYSGPRMIWYHPRLALKHLIK